MVTFMDLGANGAAYSQVYACACLYVYVQFMRELTSAYAPMPTKLMVPANPPGHETISVSKPMATRGSHNSHEHNQAATTLASRYRKLNAIICHCTIIIQQRTGHVQQRGSPNINGLFGRVGLRLNMFHPLSRADLTSPTARGTHGDSADYHFLKPNIQKYSTTTCNNFTYLGSSIPTGF